ncbi:hypothetical protein GCM10009860_00380 [Microbacterium mitrae]
MISAIEPFSRMKTSDAMGATIIAATMSHSDGVSRSRYVRPVDVELAEFCITLDE